MRRLAPTSLVLLLAASCGAPQRSAEEAAPTQSYEADEAVAPPSADRAARTGDGPIAAPDVSPTAAPGVAFNYRYAFRLSAARVGLVQEQHARACEQLGVARCRITGMRYRVVNDRDVEAMLAFKLEPTIARRFGQAASELVTRSEGMLVDAEITGTDVGSSIRATGRNIAEMNEELARLEARLARGGISSAERQRLEYEAQQLRQAIRANQASQQEQQESLATTPMVFNYGSGDLVPGFDTPQTFRRAAEEAGANFVAGVLVLFIIVVTLLPWVLLGLLGWWIFRLVRRRLLSRRARAGEAPTGEPDAVNPAG